MQAIIVIDCQNDFSDHGPLAVAGAKALAREINAFLNRLDLKHFKIVFTKDWHPEVHVSFQQWPKHCVANTKGSDYIHPLELFELKALEIKKGTSCEVDSYSAFYENKNKSPLFLFLRKNKIQTIYICGLVKDFCVLETLNDGVKLGFETYLLTDLSLALDEKRYQQNVLKDVKSTTSEKLIRQRD